MEKIIIEIIGYLGMSFVITSFLTRKITLLRFLNVIGGTLSCLYGALSFFYLKEAGLPTMILNLILVTINVSMPIRWYIHHKKNKTKYKEGENDNVDN